MAARKIPNRLKAVDFFCGAGGMSYGLQCAGIEVRGGVDNAAACKQTYELNVKGAKFIEHDITTLTPDFLAEQLNIGCDDPALVFAGCSPCQFWSKIRTDRTAAKKTAFLLENFEKFIFHFRPGFVVIENVPGILRRKDESIICAFKRNLRTNGYSFDDGVINASNFGVPQNRIRYLLVATRLSSTITLPEADQCPAKNVSDFIGVANGFASIYAGHRDDTDFLHTASNLSEKNLARIRKTKFSGGNRFSWANDPDLQIEAYKGRDKIFRDVYGRMSWDKPAPTITTRFVSLSNGRFGHPTEDRALSLREGAALQTFPNSFAFKGTNINSIARQIGNAVPPTLAYRIGEHLTRIHDGKI